MTRSAAEAFGIVDFQQLFIRMAGKRTLAAHRRLREGDGLADSEMAGLAAVHQFDVLHVDLLDADVECFELALDAGDGGIAGVGNAVGKIFVALRAQIRGGLHEEPRAAADSRAFSSFMDASSAAI